MKADESHFFSTLVPAILCMILSCSKFATGLQQQKQIAKSLDVRLEDYRDESNIPKSRKKRSVIFPTGSDLSFDVGLSIPISALSATSNESNRKVLTFFTKTASERSDFFLFITLAKVSCLFLSEFLLQCDSFVSDSCH